MTDPIKAEAVLKYENFINDVLYNDLRKIEIELNQINEKISELIQERHALKAVTDKEVNPNGFKMQMSLAPSFFMEAVVPDTSTMLVNVGLGHYLELTAPEANKYLNVLIKAYEKKADELRTKAAETSAHIKFMLISLGELKDDSKS